MKKAWIIVLLAGCLSTPPLLMPVSGQSETSSWRQAKVTFTLREGTRYEYLNHISDQTGFLFLYDSGLFRNDEVIRPQPGEYPFVEAVRMATGRRDLAIRRDGRHIFLDRQTVKEAPAGVVAEHRDPAVVRREIRGRVFDRLSGEPIPFCSVFPEGTSTGTVTNTEGGFVVWLAGRPDSVRVHFSHIGYESAEIVARTAETNEQGIGLEPRVVSLQEVVVRPVDPLREILEAYRARGANYLGEPARTAAFYREEVRYRQKNISLTEGFFDVYESGYRLPEENQFRLVRMRMITDSLRAPDRLPRIKAGIAAIFELDLVKRWPDFLRPDRGDTGYDYLHAGITYRGEQRLNVIGFQQKKGIKEPLYRGELFIDPESHALVEARFGYHPDYVEKATPLHVERTARGMRLTLQRVRYYVTYQPGEDGRYFLRHCRGELQFRVRRRGAIFGSPLEFSFEILNGGVAEGPAVPIPRPERFATRTVFTETVHPYDPRFWEEFQTIRPEEYLHEFIRGRTQRVVGDPVE